MENPERFMSEPGAAEKQSRIDEFFEEVLNLLSYDTNTRETFCEIRSREITLEGKTDSSLAHPTDDRITELMAMGRTVAVAIEIRDDFNFTQVYLAHFLTPGLLNEIRQ
jgi:hypothetical protein